jgi:hypothetical protein
MDLHSVGCSGWYIDAVACWVYVVALSLAWVSRFVLWALMTFVVVWLGDSNIYLVFSKFRSRPSSLLASINVSMFSCRSVFIHLDVIIT